MRVFLDTNVLVSAFAGKDLMLAAYRHEVARCQAEAERAGQALIEDDLLVQASVPVLPDDSEDSLSARILGEEHRLYPEAIRLFAEGRLRLDGHRVRIRENV